ncbi:MAG: hypothetical protein ACYCTI_01935 [Acidimicrobiales bacterium]
MPTALTEMTERIQDQVLDFVKTGQEAVIDAVRNISSTVEGVLPGAAKSGLAANIPVATEAVDSAFGFAGKVLEAQHGFVTQVLGAVTPGTSAPAAPATKTARTPKSGTTAAA